MTMRLNADGSDQDDWDEHWDKYGEAAEGNPANIYRRRLIGRLLGSPRPGTTLLDIGSGQGEFAISFKQNHPAIDVWGVEYSALGVRRSREAAVRAGIDVRFIERDLLQPTRPDPEQPLAANAVCSEVLEHVEDPATLVRNSLSLLAPGARVVVTVPGGPRSAFDRHIGHFRHFTALDLHAALSQGGLEVERVLRAGFPFFNLYKLAVVARGRKLVRDVESRRPGTPPSRTELLAGRLFSAGFTLNRDNSPFGWQMVAVARVPEPPA